MGKVWDRISARWQARRARRRAWLHSHRADRVAGEPIARWPFATLPVWLDLHPELPQRHRVAIMDAAAWWAVQMGREIFTPSTMTPGQVTQFEIMPLRGRVTVTPWPVERPESGGTSNLELDAEGLILRVEIRLARGLSDGRLQQAARHELGHALGLAHGGRAPESLLGPAALGDELLDAERVHVAGQLARWYG